MDGHHILVGLASILLLGVAAQWLAWRLHLPSILLLLLAGFAAGPLTGYLQPDRIFGDLLFPLVSLAVAIILFEGGLSLRYRETADVRSAILRLVLLGGTITWLLAAATAYALFGLTVEIALLLGAILMVTGPTVILPLLRHVRPRRRIAAILKWEGIAIDPYGALMAVLLYEIALLGAEASGASVFMAGLAKTIFLGGLIGLAAAAILVVLLRRYWVPDTLDEAVTLALVVAATLAANAIQEEAGLFTATLMGVILANQPFVPVHHIIDFKENLRVLMLAGLFITLSARIPLEAFDLLDWRVAVFIAVLIFVVRPAAVFASTTGEGLGLADRAFLSAMAPRGIVAASVASLFAIRLSESNEGDAALLVPVTFAVIVVTVVVYSLSSRPLARALGTAGRDPQGILFVGAQAWVCHLAECLEELGLRTCLIDTNEGNIARARSRGIAVHYGSALAEHIHDEVDLGGIGRLLAVTSNKEANALAALHFTELFGRSEVYQCAVGGEGERDGDGAPRHLRGRLLFDDELTEGEIARRIAAGATFEVHELAEDEKLDAYTERFGDRADPLFLLDDAGYLTVLTAGWRETEAPAAGSRIIHLVDPSP